MNINEEIFLGKTFLCAAQELVVKGDAFFEVPVAVVENEITAVACSEALCPFEHRSEDDHRDACQLLIVSDGAVGKRIVLHLVARAGGSEHISDDEMDSVHHPHDGDVDIDVIVPEMMLHSVESVDEYFIAGEVLTEVVFRCSVAVIFAMRVVEHFMRLVFSQNIVKLFLLIHPRVGA